jgi:hypothetical protein
MADTLTATPVPLKLRSEHDFAALQEMLHSYGFTEAQLCERFKVPSVHDLQPADGQVARSVEHPLDLFVRLFLEGDPADRDMAERYLKSQDIETLANFGLIRSGASIEATVGLYPLHGLYLVSDFKDAPDVKDAPDIVFPALTSNTRHFLAMMPDTPCDSFLELCGGTGIAALLAARNGARRAVSCDIAERSTRFADFNARLSGVRNFEALRGDLYEPIKGERFERIAAHPPYVASMEQKFIYRDGGIDGEQITRRVIAGLPEALSANGKFYLTALMVETEQESIGQRIRAMLGPAQSEFDLFILIFISYDPMD